MPKSTNTIGRFHYFSGSIYTGELDYMGYPIGPRIALMDREEPRTSPVERDDNAKRLVLAYNATLNLSIEELEQMIKDNKGN